MKNKFIAVFCMVLIISLPISYASHSDTGTRISPLTSGPRVPGEGGIDFEEIPEDILIEVEEYEPTVLISSLLEENDIPVYANLVGTRTNPFIEVPRIRNIAVRPTNLDRKYVKGITWVRPGGAELIEGRFERSTVTHATLDDLGYLVILINRIPKEEDVPEIINIDLEVVLTYDLGTGTGLNEQDLVLTENSEENWLKNVAEQNKGAFLGQSRSLVNGYIRLNEVQADGASLSVYKSDLQRSANVNLKSGEISGVYRLYGFTGAEDAFRLRLNDVKEPSDKAVVNVNVNGNLDKKLLSRGQSVYPDSSWKVKDFLRKENEEILIIRHEKTGETLEFSRLFFRTNELNITKIDESNASSSNITQKDVFEKARLFRLDNNYASSIAEYQRIIDDKDINGTIKKEASIKLNRVKALVEFEKVVSNFGNVNFPREQDLDLQGLGNHTAGAEALKEIAEIYESFGTAADIENAIRIYQRLLSEYQEKDRSLDNRDIDFKLKELTSKRGATFKGEPFFENNNFVELTLLGFELLKEGQGPTAEFLFPNTKMRTFIKVGETIADKIGYRIDNAFDWRLDVVDSESVLLARQCQPRESGCREGKVSQSLSLNRAANLRINSSNTERIELLSTKINKEAYLTVLPGLSHGISRTNLSLHIPIEGRAIKFSDDTIDDLINQTQATINQLNTVITSLSEIVETWKKVCLATFAFITIKNFFTGLRGRTIARNQALENHWRPHCTTEVAKRTYRNLDECYTENTADINKDIDAYEDSISEVNDLGIDENNKLDNLGSIDGIEDYSSIEEYEDATEQEVITQEEVRDLNLYDKLLKSGQLSEKQREAIQDKKDALSEKINRENRIAKSTLEDYNAWLNSVSQDESKRSIAWINFRDQYGDASFDRAKKLVLENIRYQNDEKFQKEFRPQFDNTNVQSFFYSKEKPDGFNEGNEITRLATVPFTTAGARFIMVGTPPEPVPLFELQEKDLTGLTGESKIVDKQGRQIYRYDEEGKSKYIVSDAEVSASGIRDNYVDAEIQYDETCKAAEMFPIGKGNYVQIEYDKFCRPVARSLWNVGIDGLFPTQDDVLLVSNSDWRIPPQEYRRDVSLAEGSIGRVNTQIQRAGVGGRVNIPNVGTYRVGVSQTRRITQAQCQDFMDPDDCNTLFLACDAVMCPTSRCNLGGRWHVNNVIQSGIIGSLVLCTPTTDTKICLSGVLASLQNIRSVFQGFNQCLKTQKVTGQSVGICDKIRSLYVCELVWRELVSLFNAKQGVLSLLGDELFGDREGGGEYTNFDASFQNAADSFSFFTSEYASGSFRAFEGKSLDEVGSEICKAALFDKYPGPDVLEQITKPESPPQFTAEFDTYPYSERNQQSRYSVFYHIYAGENPGLTNRDFIRYSVFLKNSIDPRLGFYGATERCRGTVGRINVGGFASFTVDCVADTGYDQVCVNLEGRTECGFGTVTTSFGLNYANDLIIENQIKKNIDTEEECVGTFNIGEERGLGTATAEGIGFLRTGLTRKCSLQRPGENWESVGTCGEDGFGRFLGTCWLDKNSIQIRDQQTRDEILGVDELGIPGYLDRKTKEFLVEREGKLSNEIIIKLFGEGIDNIKGAEFFIKEAENFLKEDKLEEAKEQYKEAINAYEFIVDSSANTELIAYAQFRLGKIYLRLVQLELIPRPPKSPEPPAKEEREELKEEQKEFVLGTLRALKNKKSNEITAQDREVSLKIKAGEVFVYIGPSPSQFEPEPEPEGITLIDIRRADSNLTEFQEKLKNALKICYRSDSLDDHGYLIIDKNGEIKNFFEKDSKWKTAKKGDFSLNRNVLKNSVTFVLDDFYPTCLEDEFVEE